MWVNVTVGNLGEVSENFTVTLYAFNDTATPANLTVGTQQVMDLLPNGTLCLGSFGTARMHSLVTGTT